VDKSLVKGTFRGLATFCVLTISLPICTWAGSIQAAHLTAILHDVNLLSPGMASWQASLNDEVREGTALRTGRDSRVELTFSDWIIARLSANTLFNFKGRSDCDLVQGAVLVEAPQGVKTIRVHAADVALAISGATAVFEYRPEVFKVLVLEGTGRLYRPHHLGDSILVSPGQMVFGSPNADLSDPVDFDVNRFMKTCRLIRNFQPLQSEKAIAAAIQQQQLEKSRKTLIDTNLVIFGGGTTLTLVNSATGDAASPTLAGSVSPGPSPNPNSTSVRTLAEVRR
jgi:hypothetical protein